MQRSQTLAELHSREEFGRLFFLEEISKAVYVDYRVVCIIVFIITAGVFFTTHTAQRAEPLRRCCVVSALNQSPNALF